MHLPLLSRPPSPVTCVRVHDFIRPHVLSRRVTLESYWSWLHQHHIFHLFAWPSILLLLSVTCPVNTDTELLLRVMALNKLKFIWSADAIVWQANLQFPLNRKTAFFCSHWTLMTALWKNGRCDHQVTHTRNNGALQWWPNFCQLLSLAAS